MINWRAGRGRVDDSADSSSSVCWVDDTLMRVGGVDIFDYSRRIDSHRWNAEHGIDEPEPDPNADVELWFVVGEWRHTVMLPLEVFEASKKTRVIVREDDGLISWVLNNRVWATDQQLTPTDVIWHLNKQMHASNEKIRATQMNYRPIGMDVKTWNSDPGGCDECGSVQILEWDQIIPASMGGEGTAWNVQFLCADCKRRKDARLG